MTARSPDRSMRVRSAPHEVWFSTEVEAIIDGVLTERNAATDRDAIGEQIHALTRLAVRGLARRGEPFTAADIWQVIERREIPVPEGTIPADLEPLWRRLRRRIEQSDVARGTTRGEP